MATPDWDGHVDPDDWDSLREFLCEARRHLHVAEESARTLAASPGDRTAADLARRAFGSIRSVARCLKLTPVADVALRLETVLDRHPGEAQVADLTRDAVDCTRALLAWVEPRTRGERPSGPCPTTATIRARLAAMAA